MAIEGLKIVLSAETSTAVQPLQKVTKSLQEVEKQLADTLASGDDFAESLDKIVKEGNVAGGIINFLSKEISDFKKAFANATTTEDIQKFGAALQILQDKQNQVIQSGLKAGDAIGHVSDHSTKTAAATNRLSSSFLNIGKLFDAFPGEVSHFAHSFDQIFEQFEKVGHGSETTGDKITKFAGVLGQVGLGLAISVAIGLLADFAKELLNSDAALERATDGLIEMQRAIKDTDDELETFKETSKFLRELENINLDINFGKGFQADLISLQGGMVDLIETSGKLNDKVDEFSKRFRDASKAFRDDASDAARELAGVFGGAELIPDKKIKDLTEADKELIESVKAANTEFLKLGKERNDNDAAITKQAALIRELRINDQREKDKKANDDLQKLLESRNNILEEFRIKFGAIKLPLPLFDTEIKAIPLGKLNDKLLREFLNGTLNVFEKAFKDSKEGKLDLLIPVDIHPKAEIVGISDLVRQIEDKFGDISKQVEDNVNKGLFEVPVDFKIAPEGDGQALKVIEDRVNSLASAIEGLTGQRKAIIDFDFDSSKLDPAKFNDVLDQVENIINKKSKETPLKVTVGADFKVVPEVDTAQLQKNLDAAIADALDTFLFDSLNSIGDTIGTAIGDALSGNDISDAFKGLLTTLADALSQLGKSLIKAGIIATGIGKAISALGKGNPALAIGLGIALVALSQALKNNLGQRASGGPVQGKQTYLVNEQGQEAFVSNGKMKMIEGGKQYWTAPSSGKILPAWLAKQYAAKLNLPALEGGGAVGGPTFALIGEGFGISASNPEIVAPSAFFKGLLGRSRDESISTESLIRGKDLILLHNRQTRSNVRNV